MTDKDQSDSPKLNCTTLDNDDGTIMTGLQEVGAVLRNSPSDEKLHDSFQPGNGGWTAYEEIPAPRRLSLH